MVTQMASLPGQTVANFPPKEGEHKMAPQDEGLNTANSVPSVARTESKKMDATNAIPEPPLKLSKILI